MSTKRARNWAFVIYPESLPKNWKEIITEIGIPMAVSPLHDKDMDPNGEIKKPHYHCIVTYEGPTSYEIVKRNVTDKLNGTIPIKLESIKGMYRYHIHLDNPEKYQYNDKDRIFFNGFDKNSINELTKTEVLILKKQIQNFIIDNNIIEYSDLCDILLKNECNEMYDVASSHTMFFNNYLCSKRNKQTKNIDKK